MDERRQTSAKYYFFKANFFLSLSPKYTLEKVAIGMFTFLIHLLNVYKNEISIVVRRPVVVMALALHLTLTSLKSVGAVLNMKS